MTPPGSISRDTTLAASVLLSGGIIGLPTETVYGLAALAENEPAVRRVFEVKGRPRNHPLIVHVASADAAHQWGHLNEAAESLSAAHWPGPITLLVPRTRLVPDSVTGGRDTVAIRVPAHPMALEVLRLVDTGVVAPSANRFGKVSPTRADHVMSDLGRDVDLILDGGPSSVGLESTIVECVGRDIQILRPGAVTAAEVARATGLALTETSTESRAPGMLISHYAPQATVLLVRSHDEAEHLRSETISRGVSCSVLWHEDDGEYAMRLYDDLRQADHVGIEVVIAVLPDDRGLGEAIRDRLRKASQGR